jgi:hypothetical protein
MSVYLNSVKRELGKNTGKFISNKLFGSGHATPIRVTVDKNNESRRKEKEAIKKQRDFEKNKLEREKMRLQEKKLKLQYKERRVIANAKEQKRLEKEEQEQLKQALIDSNAEELSASLNYLQAIQDIHKVEPSEHDLDQYILNENHNEYIVNNWSAFYHQNDEYFNYIDSLMILSCMAASSDLQNSITGKKYSIKEAEELVKIGKLLGIEKEVVEGYWDYLDHNLDNGYFETCCKTLNNGPIFLKLQAIGFVHSMVEASRETRYSISEVEFKYLNKVWAGLKLNAKLLFSFKDFREFDFINKLSLYNYKDLSKNDGPRIEFDIKPVLISLDIHVNTECNELKENIAQDQKNIIALENNRSNKNWMDEGLDILLKEIRIVTELQLITKEIQDDIVSMIPKFIIKYLKIKDFDFILKPLSEGKAKKIQRARISEKQRLCNTESYLTYKKITLQVADIRKKIDENEVLLKERQATLKQAKAQIEKDLEDFNKKNKLLWKEFKAEMASDFEFSSQISKVKNGDFNSFKNLVYKIELLSFLEEFGCECRIEIKKNYPHLEIILNTSEVVPATKKEIRENGLKLIDKSLTASEYNLISQDFLCSVILRTARELFANFPNLNQFDIHVFDNLLNSAKGIMEEVKLVEVKIDKVNFSKLRLSNVDPSEALELFNPKMSFSRSSGFKSIQ